MRIIDDRQHGTNKKKKMLPLTFFFFVYETGE